MFNLINNFLSFYCHEYCVFKKAARYLVICIFIIFISCFHNAYSNIPDNPSIPKDDKSNTEKQIAVGFSGTGSGSGDSATKNLPLINKRVFQARALRDSVEWQQFLAKKELADLNYDLYRIHGPKVSDKIVMAQDPKGYLVNKHNRMFCSDLVDKNCQMHSPLYTFADMRAAILMQNFYTSPEEINLATEVIRNIVNPFPSNIALDMQDANNQEKDRPDKKAKLAEAYASEARLGVARNSFNSILLDRLPLDLLKGKASTEESNSSILGIMEQEAKDRFENPEWHKFVQTATEEHCLRELLQIEALVVWMLYNGYKQNERKEALLATIVAQQEELKRLIGKNDKKN